MPLKSSTSPVFYWGKIKKHIRSYLFIWQLSEFVNSLNSGKNIDEKLNNKIVQLVTGNECMWFTYCYSPIEDYENSINKQNIIFGILSNLKINLKNVQYYLSTNDRYVIVDGRIFKNYLKIFLDFYNFFGIIFITKFKVDIYF